MRREWNDRLFESDLPDDEAAAVCLSAVAEPRFLDALKRALDSAAQNGEKVCIATHRGKYDAEGNQVGGTEGAAGQFRTDGYQFTTADGDWRVEAEPLLHGTGAAQMLALELAVILSPDIVRSILDVKVILDRLGGQVWIAPYVQEGQVLGFVFVWDHISRLLRGKEPDAKIEEPLPLVVESK